MDQRRARSTLGLLFLLAITVIALAAFAWWRSRPSGVVASAPPAPAVPLELEAPVEPPATRFPPMHADPAPPTFEVPSKGPPERPGSRMTARQQRDPPRVRFGATTVSGRLPPEVIRRIVRQNSGRFRLCYEQGLSRNPLLAGTLTVRFVIGREGMVSNVVSGGATFSDADVVRCTLSAFYGLQFPKPEDGIVTVVHPIMFSVEP